MIGYTLLNGIVIQIAYQEKCNTFLKDICDLKKTLPEVPKSIDKYFSRLIHMRANNTDSMVTELGAQIVFFQSRLSKDEPKKREKTIGTEPLAV